MKIAYKTKDMTQFNDIGGGLYLNPQPSEQDLQEAKGCGIQTVIDLRPSAETAILNATLVSQYGLNYMNTPASKTSPSEQQIEAFDQALQQNNEWPISASLQHRHARGHVTPVDQSKTGLPSARSRRLSRWDSI